MASLPVYHLTRCDALADDIDPYQEGIWAPDVWGTVPNLHPRLLSQILVPSPIWSYLDRRPTMAINNLPRLMLPPSFLLPLRLGRVVFPHLLDH